MKFYMYIYIYIEDNFDISLYEVCFMKYMFLFLETYEYYFADNFEIP